MPRTFKNLYPAIYDFENLYRAYLKARRGKRYRAEVLEFAASLEERLMEIQMELIHKTYETGPYRYFYVYEPKKRLVAALPFKDRVVHHAVCNIVEPIFERRFIYDSYACRRGKGTHAGADRVTEFLRAAGRRWGRVYCLQGDIASYFPSVNHRILLAILGRTIACRDTMWLLQRIISSAADPDDPNPRGIPIGNLTSQLFANIYLHELDHFIKHTLRAGFYVRYMDDFVLLAGDKATLWAWRREIEGFLEAHLALRLNGKTSIFPAAQGIDFLGYRIWPTHRLLRNRSMRRIKRALRRFARDYAAGKMPLERVRATLHSWLGHARHANSYNFRQRLLADFVLRRDG